MINEQTFIIIKPDGIQRSLIGEVVSRLERVGLKLVAMKMLLPTEELTRKHYTIDPEWIRKTGEKNLSSYAQKGIVLTSTDPMEIGNGVLNNLVSYLTSGPVVVMVWQGVHAVEIVRKLVGSTEPLSSDVGTIRGDFVLDSYKLSDKQGRAIRNVMHASGSVEEAKGEITLWFTPTEVLDYRHIQDEILYQNI